MIIEPCVGGIIKNMYKFIGDYGLNSGEVVTKDSLWHIYAECNSNIHLYKVDEPEVVIVYSEKMFDKFMEEI